MSGYIDADEQSEAAIRRHEAFLAFWEFLEKHVAIVCQWVWQPSFIKSRQIKQLKRLRREFHSGFV